MTIKVINKQALGVGIFEIAAGLGIIISMAPVVFGLECVAVAVLLGLVCFGGGGIMCYLGFEMITNNAVEYRKPNNPLDVDLDKLYGEDTTRYDDD